MNLFIFPRNAQCCLTLASRASVNILQSGVRTSVVLNLDVRYALAIKSDVTLHAGRKKTIFDVCVTMHYAGHSRSQRSFSLKEVGNQTVGLHD